MKALWAFEPFHQDKVQLKGMHDALSLLTGSTSAIDVGFVVTHTESLLNLAFDVPKEERFSTYPRKLIIENLKEARVKLENKRIHIVDCETMSTTKSVDALLKLAKVRGCGLIGLFTHARKGYARFAVGSFAETVIHRSKVSLLIFNPQTRMAPKIRQTFFASDFSPASKKHLKQVIAQCKKLRSGLTVFHHAEMTYEWSLSESSPGVRAYRQRVNRMKIWIENECRRANVPSEVVVQTDLKPTSELVLLQAGKKKADLVIVSAKTGILASLMGGSVTRQVVRGSNVPVLVLK